MKLADVSYKLWCKPERLLRLIQIVGVLALVVATLWPRCVFRVRR